MYLEYEIYITNTLNSFKLSSNVDLMINIWTLRFVYISLDIK